MVLKPCFAVFGFLSTVVAICMIVISSLYIGNIKQSHNWDLIKLCRASDGVLEDGDIIFKKELEVWGRNYLDNAQEDATSVVYCEYGAEQVSIRLIIAAGTAIGIGLAQIIFSLLEFRANSENKKIPLVYPLGNLILFILLVIVFGYAMYYGADKVKGELFVAIIGLDMIVLFIAMVALLFLLVSLQHQNNVGATG